MPKKKTTEAEPAIIQSPEDMQAAIRHAFGFEIDIDACRTTFEQYAEKAKEEDVKSYYIERIKSLEAQVLKLENEKTDLVKRNHTITMNNAALHNANSTMIDTLKATQHEINKLIKIWEDRA